MHSSLSFSIALLALLMTLSTLASAQNTRGSTAGSATSNSSPAATVPRRSSSVSPQRALEDVYATLNDGSLLPIPKSRTAGMQLSGQGRSSSPPSSQPGLAEVPTNNNPDNNRTAANSSRTSPLPQVRQGNAVSPDGNNATAPSPSASASTTGGQGIQGMQGTQGTQGASAVQNTTAAGSDRPTSAAAATLPDASSDTSSDNAGVTDGGVASGASSAVATAPPPPEPHELPQSATLPISGSDRMLSGADQSALNRFLALMEANQNGRLTVQIYPDADAPSDEASITAAARFLAVQRYLILQAGTGIMSRVSLNVGTAAAGSAESGRVLVSYRP